MTVRHILSELAYRGIELVSDGDKLQYRPKSAMTFELQEQLRCHKAELLIALETLTAESFFQPTPAMTDETELIDPPPACVCGSIAYWWDTIDRPRCSKCKPPLRSLQLVQLAADLKALW
jgi:hypothetical protein